MVADEDRELPGGRRQVVVTGYVGPCRPREGLQVLLRVRWEARGGHLHST